MKKKIGLSVLLMLLLLLTYGLGYRTGFSHAQKGRRVIVALDATDSQQPSGKGEYESYFTKQNPVPDRVNE